MGFPLSKFEIPTTNSFNSTQLSAHHVTTNLPHQRAPHNIFKWRLDFSSQLALNRYQGQREILTQLTCTFNISSFSILPLFHRCIHGSNRSRSSTPTKASPLWAPWKRHSLYHGLRSRAEASDSEAGRRSLSFG